MVYQPITHRNLWSMAQLYLIYAICHWLHAWHAAISTGDDNDDDDDASVIPFAYITVIPNTLPGKKTSKR